MDVKTYSDNKLKSKIEIIKLIFDEVQDTLMIAGAMGMWAAFEFYSIANPEMQHETTTRTALITITTNLFTFRFTKSSAAKQNGGTHH